MSINIYQSTISTSSTPLLIGPNPIPDGYGAIYVNLAGAPFLGIDFLTWQSNIVYGLYGSVGFGGNVEQPSANLLVQILPDSTNLYINYVWNSDVDNGFYIFSDIDEVDIYVNLQITPATTSGTITANNMYTSAGLVTNSMTWVGSATTLSGAFTVDISSAGFTTVNSINATALNNTGDPTATVLASLTSVSATTATGNVIVSGGVFAPDGTTVYITVNGQ